MRVDEHITTIDGVPVFYRSAGSAAQPGSPASPIIYLHDALTSSDEMLPFLERTGGIAPDLIGFGRSAKGGHLDYSPQGLADFVERFLAHLGLQSVRLLGHGWGGALALLLALHSPALAERQVLVNAVPLLEGFTWRGPPRLLRRPAVGELVMGAVPRSLLARVLRRATAHPEVWNQEQVSAVWEQFDHGTQRALLRLHRAADEARLAELGSRLGELQVPTLIVWGDEDPWLAPQLGDDYGARLSRARVEHVPDAGHWPWLDQPHVIDLAASFLNRS